MNLNRIGLLDDKENPLVNPQSALAQYQPQRVATAPLPPIEYASPAQIQHIQIGGKYKRRF